MALSPVLDLELVRTLVLIAEEESFTRAAERVGRTQSAISLQVQRLEAALGQSLVERSKGGHVRLTVQGNALVERSRNLLALNDDIVRSVRSPSLSGAVRLGVDEGYTRRCLPDILSRFAETHPLIEVEISRAASCELVPRLLSSDLDVLLCADGHEPRQWPATELWRGPLAWITSESHDRHLDDPLPLSLSPGNSSYRPRWNNDCIWRTAALRALERVGRAYRIVSTSTSITSQLAAVQAGLAVSVALSTALPPGLRTVRSEEGLPPLPDVGLLLLKAREPRQPVTDALVAHIIETFDAKEHEP